MTTRYAIETKNFSTGEWRNEGECGCLKQTMAAYKEFKKGIGNFGLVAVQVVEINRKVIKSSEGGK